GEHWKNNLSLAQAFAHYAGTKGCTAAQLALAWVLAQGENIIPIPGTKKQKYLIENAEAVNVHLTQEDMEAIENILQKYPNIGARYTAEQMKMINR
ncbi:MAG: aldo/keto reductase, partial [Chitinophagaceae bacterium]|nr:aldo/keto reductase [Chitinophagaceae bacterium]